MFSQAAALDFICLDSHMNRGQISVRDRLASRFMTADPQFNAPMDAEPDLATTYPERYAVVWLMDGVAGTPVYKCHTEERGNFEVGRTYLRDALGIHGDPRWPVQSIAGTANEAMEALGQPSSAHIPAVAVPVKAAMELFPGLPFAEDGYHPTLGVQVVP